MQRVLSTGLWKEIKAIAVAAKRRRVAVAYVTQDLIGFKKGDVLVLDATERAIRSGETDAKLLRRLHRRGVQIHCCVSPGASKPATLGRIKTSQTEVGWS
jgi:hypothetical protein